MFFILFIYDIFLHSRKKREKEKEYVYEKQEKKIKKKEIGGVNGCSLRCVVVFRSASVRQCLRFGRAESGRLVHSIARWD
jgi:hypothetical protein